ncbi:MAG TPA: CsbD family protein [Gaiellaceae bacterium]|nr:CsbD family protein [Gaiellaceae bacterium]
MSNADEAKGRLKEAAGDLTDDKDLKREGKIDQAAGAAKDRVDDVSEKAKDALSSDS